MKKLTAPALVSAAALGLAACSQNARNETSEAANAVGTDIGNTAEAGANSVDNALDAAGNSMDAMAANSTNATDNAANATGNALIDAGNAVKGK